MNYDPTDLRRVSGNDWIPLLVIALISLPLAVWISAMHLGVLPAVAPTTGAFPKVGGVLIGISAIVALLNFYLSFVRYWLFRLRGGSDDDYDFVSGLPSIGSVLLCLGAVLTPPSVFVLGGVLAIALLDTAGVPWFFLALLLDAKREKRLPNKAE